jgi:hypothetical protein
LTRYEFYNKIKIVISITLTTERENKMATSSTKRTTEKQQYSLRELFYDNVYSLEKHWVSIPVSIPEKNNARSARRNTSLSVPAFLFYCEKAMIIHGFNFADEKSLKEKQRSSAFINDIIKLKIRECVGSYVDANNAFSPSAVASLGLFKEIYNYQFSTPLSKLTDKAKSLNLSKTKNVTLPSYFYWYLVEIFGCEKTARAYLTSLTKDLISQGILSLDSDSNNFSRHLLNRLFIQTLSDAKSVANKGFFDVLFYL